MGRVNHRAVPLMCCGHILGAGRGLGGDELCRAEHPGDHLAVEYLDYPGCGQSLGLLEAQPSAQERPRALNRGWLCGVAIAHHSERWRRASRTLQTLRRALSCQAGLMGWSVQSRARQFGQRDASDSFSLDGT